MLGEILLLRMSSSSVSPGGGILEAQNSVTPSEDWASEEEEDYYENYYAEGDEDVDGECAGGLIIALCCRDVWALSWGW